MEVGSSSQALCEAPEGSPAFLQRINSGAYEVSTPMRCIAPMDVVSKAELRSENTH